MFEFSRSVRRQVEFDGRELVSVEGGGCSKRSNLVLFIFTGGLQKTKFFASPYQEQR